MDPHRHQARDGGVVVQQSRKSDNFHPYDGRSAVADSMLTVENGLSIWLVVLHGL